MLSAEDRLAIAQEVMSVDWKGHSDDLLNLIMTSTGREPVAKRGEMRDLRAFKDYFTKSEWEMFLSLDVFLDTKTNLIIQKLVSLGCRRPSGHTKKLAATLWIHVSDSNSLSEETKAILRTRFNKSLTKALKGFQNPVQYMLLPSPRVFKDENPDAYMSLFQKEEPVP